jgi:cholesterol transport system auxiliary component
MRFLALARLLVLVPISGCALLSRGAPLRVAFYDPAFDDPRRAADPRAQDPAPPDCTLALGRVDRADDLRAEIQFRPSSYEADYYDGRRWTEVPDNYLRRALERSLFEGGRCKRSLSSSDPTLDARLVSFGELRSPEAAHVAVHVVLYEGTTVLWEGTVESTEPVPPDESFDGVVRAMSRALADVVARIASRVREPVARRGP